jgi:hypothetical protein
MSDRCYIATRKGLFTMDRGASKWRISHAAFVGDNVTLVMHDPRNDTLYAALNHGHFGIKLHRSTDRGETWTEVATPQYPPMPEGYVPKPIPFFNKTLDWALKLIWGFANKDEKRCPLDGRVVVNRTRDGGKTFETLRRGLPQEYPYDLVYRHGLDIDESGNRLAFGSTTGSVWVSEDAGDSWQAVSSNLPPVYAVRFVK